MKMKAPLSLKIAGGLLALLGLVLLGFAIVFYLLYLEGGIWGMKPQLEDLIQGFILGIAGLTVGVGIVFSKKIAVYATIPLSIWIIIIFILEAVNEGKFINPENILISIYLLALIYLSVSYIIKSRKQKQNNVVTGEKI